MSLFTLPKVVPVSGGEVYPSARLYFYLTGSSTDAVVYTDAAHSTPHTQPVVADSGGVFAPIYKDDSVAYRVVLKSSTGATIYEADPIPVISVTQTQIGSALWPQTAAEAGASVTPTYYYYEPGDVRRYGALGGGSMNNDTSAVQAAVNCNATAVIPPGFNCGVRNSITIPDGVTLIGGTITSSVDGAATLIVGDDCRIEKLLLIGPANSDFDMDENGILIAGTSAGAYASGLVVRDCFIRDFGMCGIRGEWVENVCVENCTIQDCGYAGVMFLSGTDCHVSHCYITGVTPGSGGNAYGISFTRDGTTDSEATYPRSKNCSAVDNVIENVTDWEALDTHSGTRIVFSNNAISGCKIGINVGPCVSVANAAYGVLAPNHCVVSNNTIDGESLDGYGIAVTGAATTSVGSPNEYGFGNVIEGNTLYRCGYANNNISGAIYVHTQKGLTISGNVVREPLSNGVAVIMDTLGLSMTGNVIIDPHDGTLTNPSCLAIYSGNVSGNVTGNSFLKINGTLSTYTGVYATYWTTAGTSSLRINGNHSTCTNEFYNEAYNASFGSFTGTLTGATGTGTIEYSLSNRIVTLEIPAIAGAAGGTAVTITGMPVAIRPSAAQTFVGITKNNGTEAIGKVVLGTDGVLTLYNVMSATFANTSTQGIGACSLTYHMA